MLPIAEVGAVMFRLTIGSSTMAWAFAIAREKGLPAGGHECNFLGIHRMRLAVVHDHTQILHRITGNCTRLQHLTHALLHRRDELGGNGAAFDCIHKLKAGTAPQWLDPQKHLAVLTGAAGSVSCAGGDLQRCA